MTALFSLGLDGTGCERGPGSASPPATAWRTASLCRCRPGRRPEACVLALRSIWTVMQHVPLSDDYAWNPKVACGDDVRLHGQHRGRHHGAEGRWAAMRARWASPFCPGDGPQAGLLVFSRRPRYTTHHCSNANHECTVSSSLVASS